MALLLVKKQILKLQLIIKVADRSIRILVLFKIIWSHVNIQVLLFITEETSK